MRLLADQDVYAVTVSLLRHNEHDVVTATDLGLSSASDAALLQAAIDDQRLLLTRDRDFGTLEFAGQIQYGVIYLRIAKAAIQAVHTELLRVLDSYAEEDLRRSLVVVEAGRHRIRRIP